MSDSKATEIFKSMVSLSTEGLKALLLVNGGAIVALLTFIGNSKAFAPSAQFFILPVAAFLLGLVFCVVAFCSAYATQFTLYNEQFSDRGFAPRSHMKYFRWTKGLVALSLLSFSIGAVSSLCALGNVGSTEEAKTNVAEQQTSKPSPAANPTHRVGSGCVK